MFTMATLCTSTWARSTVNSSGSVWPTAHHGELDRRAARAAHARHGGVEIGADRRSVDGGNHVAALDSRGGRGRIAERPHHAQRAIRGRHFDADARVGAGRADAQVGVFLRVEIGRIGIEPAHHAAQRIVDELGMRNGVHVFALHAIDDFRELRGFGGRERRLLGSAGSAARTACAGAHRRDA